MAGHRELVGVSASGDSTGAFQAASPLAPHPPAAPSPRMRGEGKPPHVREEGILREREANENGPLRGRRCMS